MTLCCAPLKNRKWCVVRTSWAFIKFLQYFQGFQFGEIGHMQAVILVEHLKNAHPFPTRQTEKMQGRIIHTEKHRKDARLFITQKMGMKGLTFTIRTCEKVEVELRVRAPSNSPKGERGVRVKVKIGIDADKATEVHKESQMEIGY